MLKIRRSHDRLIFNMGIPYLWKTVLILRRGPGRDISKSLGASDVDMMHDTFVTFYPVGWDITHKISKHAQAMDNNNTNSNTTSYTIYEYIYIYTYADYFVIY